MELPLNVITPRGVNGLENNYEPTIKSGFFYYQLNFFLLYLNINSITMKKFFKRLIKRLYVKWALSTRYRMFLHLEQVNDTTKTSLAICRMLINHDSSKFLIAPLSGKRYIKNEEVDLFIIIYDNHLSITNHVYHYDVVLNQRERDKINYMYDNKTERIRQQFENDIMGQINKSLHSIQEKLQKKT